MDGAPLLRLDRAGFVDRFADDVHDAAERLVADGDRDRLAGVDHFLAADEALGRVHGDGAHRVLAEMLRDLEDEPVAAVLGLERVQNRRQVPVELDVDHRAGDLRDAPDDALDIRLHCHVGHHYTLSIPRPI